MSRQLGTTLLSSLGVILLLALAACGESEPTKVVVLTAVTPPMLTATGGPTPAPMPTHPPAPAATPTPTQVPVTLTPFPTPDPAWVDVDGDGFPDAIEPQMGADPFVDECLAEAGCGPAQVANAGKALNIVLVLDGSARMEEKLDGVPMIVLLREEVISYTYSLPLGINVGEVIYGHRQGPSATLRAGDCAATELVYPLGPVDRETFRVALHGFAPGPSAALKTSGVSPAGRALEVAQESLAGQVGQTNLVVLVSTSGDTCGADLCGLAEKLRTGESGSSVRVHAIGLDVDSSEAREQIRCLADVTGGIYYEARSTQEFEMAWDTLLRQATQWARSASCMAPNHHAFSQCLSQRLTDYLHWAQESGWMQEQTDYGIELMERMNKRVMQERQLDLPPTSTP